MKTSELSRLPLAPPWAVRSGADSDVVLASRIRLARNLAEYPFPHTASPEMRAEANERVTKALRSELTPEPFAADAFELDPASLCVRELSGVSLTSRSRIGCSSAAMSGSWLT